jgi:SepF-like predicted cell division protein (DUF552 family)
MPPPNGPRTRPRWRKRASAVRHGDIVIANLLFIEEHITAILPDLQARRDECDAMIGVIADAQIVQADPDGRRST